MRPKEAFPIGLCSVMSLVGELGKGSSLPTRNSLLESGVEPRQHTPEPCLPPSHCTSPPSSIPRAGLIRQGECCSHPEQERRQQPAVHCCWRSPGVTECHTWSLQARAAEPQGLHQAHPDARVLGKRLGVQLEIGKDCSLEGRLQRQMQILFWQAVSSFINNEHCMLVIDALSQAQIPRENSRRKIL